MAFDGFCVASIVNELQKTIKDGRISKISQPEKDEVVMLIKGSEGQKKLFISCNATLPLVYITEESKDNPLTPPSFLMVLRKYLQGGRITDIVQPGLERIINIYVEHQDEMGYLCKRVIVIELMGKYSNIILCDGNDKILDAAKRIPFSVSSVREVLPGRIYFVPNTLEKKNPLELNFDEFCETVSEFKNDRSKFSKDEILNFCKDVLTSNYTGISSSIASKIAMESVKLYQIYYRKYCIPDGNVCENEKVEVFFDINNEHFDKIFFDTFKKHIDCVKNGAFSPTLILKDGAVKDFFVTSIENKEDEEIKKYDSVSKLLFDFYNEKNKSNNMRSKSLDLRKLVTNILDKDLKKLDLQKKQLEDTKNKDKYKLYGELLQAYSYDLKGNEKSYEALNYSTNEKVLIPLNPSKTVFENSQSYYSKYNKLKRTEMALATQTVTVQKEIEYLESIMTYIELASSEGELSEIKGELYEKGFIKKNPKAKGKLPKSKITHLKYKDYDIYIGKNNIQNEYVTFKCATGNDWWFHAKGVPGSHIIVKCDKENPANEWDMPNDVFEAVGALAVKYSKHNDNAKHEVDYTRKKHIKKPAEGTTGNVIYHTYYSLVATGDLSEFHFEYV